MTRENIRDDSLIAYPRRERPDEPDDEQTEAEAESEESLERKEDPFAAGRPRAMLGLASPPPLDPGTPGLLEQGGQQNEAQQSEPQREAKCHVLLVDDNKINLQLLVMFMKKCGFSYERAENGQEALDKYTDACTPASQITGPGRRRFDYVLMDISMPVMDGIEATKRIREMERENQLPPSNIIALTGLASADAQQDANSAGVNVYMPKPVRFAELKKLLIAR